MENEKRSFAFVQNLDCPYFPCHEGIPEEDFNCLFCFCPLYTLGQRCGGACTYTEGGIKDCGKCGFPHRRENYDAVCKRFPELADLARKPEQE